MICDACMVMGWGLPCCCGIGPSLLRQWDACAADLWLRLFPLPCPLQCFLFPITYHMLSPVQAPSVCAAVKYALRSYHASLPPPPPSLCSEYFHMLEVCKVLFGVNDDNYYTVSTAVAGATASSKGCHSALCFLHV